MFIWSGEELATPIDPPVSPIKMDTPLTTSVWAKALMPVVVPFPTSVTLPPVLVTAPPRVTLPLFAAASIKIFPLDPKAPLVVMALKAEKLIAPVQLSCWRSKECLKFSDRQQKLVHPRRESLVVHLERDRALRCRYCHWR